MESYKNMYQKIVKAIIVLLIVFGPTSLIAQEPAKSESTDILDMSLEALLNTDVTTASKSAEKQSDAPGIISVVTSEELARFGGTTLRDILDRVPGLISVTNYYTRTSIAARGDAVRTNSGHVLFLINGRPMREIHEGGVSSNIIESFPVNIIEKIEVIKGPGSVLYGSDAYSAAINIITKTAEKNSFSVTGMMESNGGSITSSEITGKIGDLGIVVAGRLGQKHNWETPYKKTVGTPARDTTVNLSIPDNGPGAYLGLNYKGLSLTASYDGWTSDLFSSSNIRKVEINQLFTNLGYNLQVSKNWSMDFNATNTYSSLLAEKISDRTSYNLLGEWTNFINLSDKSKFVFGGLYSRNHGKGYNISVTPNAVTAEDDVNSYAFYSQIDYRLLENLKLIGGVQMIKVDSIKMTAVPRFGAIWSPTSRISVKALYSGAFKAPSIMERTQNYGGTFKGDRNLKPEKVATMDLSISYQGEQSQASINVFQSKLNEIIQVVYTSKTNRVYKNVGSLTFKGIEFEGKHYLNKNFFLSASMLYQENKNDSVSNLVPVANFGAKGGISYTGNGLTVGLFDIYQGDLDSKFVGTRNPYQGAYNLLNLNSIFNMNKLFSWTFKPELSLLLNIDNVLDKPYFGYDWGGSSKDAIPFIPGRTIYFGLNVKF